MEQGQIRIPDEYNYLFTDRSDKYIAESLASYLVFDFQPKTTPAMWQDVEIYIRYKKREVWHLTDEQFNNAANALVIYRIKYIIEHLKKSEISAVFKKLFAQKLGNPRNKNMMDLFAEKFHAPVDDFILVQEKLIITKDKLAKFDDIFKYPCWLEFDQESSKIIYDKILHDQLTDEQIDYFFGASDTMTDYSKWFEVAKHVLCTTNNPHTFWVAGDILNIVWKASPDDEECEQWFKDQVFEIFWPRVKSTWPIIHQDDINFDISDEFKILKDSIGWLCSLDDIEERLPDLESDNSSESEDDAPGPTYQDVKKRLLSYLKAEEVLLPKLLNQFFELVDLTYTESEAKDLEKIANEKLIPVVKKLETGSDLEGDLAMIKNAVSYIKRYIKNTQKEEKRLLKFIKQNISTK